MSQPNIQAEKKPVSDLHVFLRRLVHHKTAWRAFTAILRGVGKFFTWYHGWITAVDKAHLIGDNATTATRIRHDNWCHFRRAVSWVTVLVGTGFLIFCWAAFGMFGMSLLALATAGGLGAWGRPKESGVLVEKEAVPVRPVVNGDTARQIVAAATTGMKADDWQKIRVLGPGVVWDSRHVWWAIRLQMPGVVPGSAVVKAKEGIMAALGVGPSQLDIKVHPQNNSVITLMGTDIDPYSRPPAQTPFMTAEQISIWNPIPIAQDKRDNPVVVSLVMTGWIVGAIPRMGKTNLMCLLALAVALDPDADLAVFDFKGGADWRMFIDLAIQCGIGRSPAVYANLIKHLKAMQDEIARRGELLSELADEDHERVPNGQLTKDLAQDPALSLQPIITFIDEIQWAFKHPKYGREIVNLVEDIAKTGQYVGIWLVVGTQRPDVDSVPSQVRDVLGTRAAGYCTSRHSSETILGSAAYQEGWDAARLPRTAGVFILYGADDTETLVEAQDVRVHRCDLAQRRMVAMRARDLREKLMRLPHQRREALAVEEPVLLRVCREIQGDEPYVLAETVLAKVNAREEYTTEQWSQRGLGITLRKLGYGSFPNYKDGLRGRNCYNFRIEPKFD
jgi:S-DNA-T family DNA segregation ATPase FtsK/SpoIIIE